MRFQPLLLGPRGVAVCMPGCNPLEANCEEEEEEEEEACVGFRGNYACLSPQVFESMDVPDCDGTTCGPTPLCANAAALPDCLGNGFCTDLCSRSQPDCAAGLDCIEMWPADDYPELVDVGACTLPGVAEASFAMPRLTPG